MPDDPQEIDASKPDAAPVTELTPPDVAERVEEMSAVDGAEMLGELPREQAAEVAEILDPATAASILSKMDAPLAATVISDMEIPEAAVLLECMRPDDRVDILGYLPRELHDQIVGEMNALEARETRRLEQYRPDTAGGIMTTAVSALTEDMTVEEAIAALRKLKEQSGQLFYSYVTDRSGHLVGVLSMRDLIFARPEQRLREIMIQKVTSVPASMDQEEVAELFRRYDYLAMPVVDESNHLVGLITVDDVVDVIQEEATEDVHRMFGAGAEEALTSPWHFSYRKRVVWLLVNLGTAFLAGAVVGMFEGIIERLAVLAVYMPVIAGSGGNASAQAMAVVVRGISRGKVDRALLRHVIRRELRVGICTGLTCGTVTALMAMAWHRNPALGLVVFLALAINHTVACASGAGIPFIMKKLGFDPAQSATIFATTVTDIGGFFALLGLATLAINWLTGTA
jgi:magnesium transporter